MYPDLELWIDDGDDGTAALSMEGTLDERTVQSVALAVSGLVAEGYREVVLHSGSIEIPVATSMSVLTELQKLFETLRMRRMDSGRDLGSFPHSVGTANDRVRRKIFTKGPSDGKTG